MKRFLKQLTREFLLPMATLFIFVAPVRSAVIDWNWVPTGSMKPTILEGDLVLVNKLAYNLRVPFTTRSIAGWSSPQRGDIVVFISPADQKRLVKRVIGLPGDVISMHGDALTINGQPLDYSAADVAPFSREIREDPNPCALREALGNRPHQIIELPHVLAIRSFAPYRVPAGSYFVMGDFRDDSFDSRYFGTVPRDAILGKATGILVSFDLHRYLLPRVQRFAHPLE